MKREDSAEVGIESFHHEPGGDVAPEELARADPGAQRRRPRRRHPAPAPAPGPPRPGRVRRADRPRQGRGRADHGERRPAHAQPRRGDRALHARPGSCGCSRRPASSCPARGRSCSAARSSWASRWPSCCWRRTPPSPTATRARATSPRSAARPTCSWPPWARPGLVTGDMVGEGAVVIDVGTNRTDDGLVGDVDFDAAQRARPRDHAGARRRRADDARDAAREHAEGRARPLRLRRSANHAAVHSRRNGSATAAHREWITGGSGLLLLVAAVPSLVRARRRAPSSARPTTLDAHASAWDAFTVLDVLLALGALAAIAVARGHRGSGDAAPCRPGVRSRSSRLAASLLLAPARSSGSPTRPTSRSSSHRRPGAPERRDSASTAQRARWLGLVAMLGIFAGALLAHARRAPLAGGRHTDLTGVPVRPRARSRRFRRRGPEPALDVRAAAAGRLGRVRGGAGAPLHDRARLVQHQGRRRGAQDPGAGAPGGGPAERRDRGRGRARGGRARGGPGAERLAGGRHDRPDPPRSACSPPSALGVAAGFWRASGRESKRLGPFALARRRGLHQRAAGALPHPPGARLRRDHDREDRRAAGARGARA